MNKPTFIGITGGIGSGKTLITKLFSILGVPVYNADSRAKALMNTKLKEAIIIAFGRESYKDGGELNRAYLAAKVFSNKNQLRKLNAIVHPAVEIDCENWLRKHCSANYVIKEAALLIESQSYKKLDKLIVVSAPKYLRIKRIKMRDPFRKENEIEKIIKNQTLDNEKEKLGHFLIVNNEKKLVIPQVIEIDKAIKKSINI